MANSAIMARHQGEVTASDRHPKALLSGPEGSPKQAGGPLWDKRGQASIAGGGVGGRMGTSTMLGSQQTTIRARPFLATSLQLVTACAIARRSGTDQECGKSTCCTCPHASTKSAA